MDIKHTGQTDQLDKAPRCTVCGIVKFVRIQMLTICSW